ncbi:MAG: hypothetical protein ACI9OJ_001731 [Myxococcota bacterium]|jgi:hypothetical protein
MKGLIRFSLVAAACTSLVACGADEADVIDTNGSNGTNLPGSQGKADASSEAVFLDFSWEGKLVTSACWNAETQIENQALYTIGQLNGDNSVGRLDKLAVSDVRTTMEGGMCNVTYSARMPVAWGKKNDIPTTYELKLPLDVSTKGAEAFTEAYAHDCVDSGAHDVTAGIFWYYYRPERFNCKLDDASLARMQVDVAPSPIATTGKYPEYDKVWEDDTFRVVAVFGKYEDDATKNDAGISAYNTFVSAAKKALLPYKLATEPVDVKYNPGVDVPEVTFHGTMDDGRTVHVVAMLIDSVGSADSKFWDRYESLTPDADFIVYNGHAGLGANIRKLASKGEWKTGQYAVVFMNGCDTYAYVDSALFDAHAAVNSDDPEGTKYMDVISNALPSFFREMSDGTLAIMNAFIDYENPQTYEQIFTQIDKSEVVIVSGEHDNTFTPDGGTDPVDSWQGLSEKGSVQKGEETRFETPKLAAGRYGVQLTGTGDADLYVRLGGEATLGNWDCRPYRNGTEEYCEVSLDTPTTIHVAVIGWEAQSEFELSIGAIE